MRGTSIIRGVRRRATLLVVAWLAFAALMPVLVPTRVDALPGRAPDVLDARQGACGSPPIPEAVANVGTLGLDLGDGGFQRKSVGDWGDAALNFAGPYAIPKAATTTATAKGVAVVGAFLLGYVGTCYAVDWLWGAGNRPPVTIPWVPPVGLELGEPQDCSAFSVPTPPDAANGPTLCAELSWEMISTAWRRASFNDTSLASREVSGVRLPPLPTEIEWCARNAIDCNDARPLAFLAPTGSTWCAFATSVSLGSSDPACQIDQPNPGSTIIALHCEGNDDATHVSETVGGVCGIRRGMTLGLFNSLSPSQYRAFVPVSVNARDLGWQRMLRFQTDCRSLAGATTTAVGWAGPTWDRMPSERLQIMQCPPGFYPTRIRQWRVPANAPTWDPTRGGTVAADWATMPSEDNLAVRLIADWQAPSSWSSGSAPGWLICLEAGATCGSPEVDNGVCVWGGVTAPSEFCSSPVLDPDTEGMPVPSPSITDPQPIAYPNPGDSTAAQPGTQPGTNPLDPDGNGRIETEAGAPGNAGDIPDGEGGDCWPNGWGWFNPAEWVLKPIKCAFEWAFVPDSDFVSNWWDAWLNNCYEEPPCSYAFAAYDFVDQSSISFVDWSEGGPDCIDVAGEEVCPRTWDTGAGVAWVPGWVSTAVVVLFWTLLVVAIVKFF